VEQVIASDVRSPSQDVLENGPFHYIDVLETTQLSRLIVEENVQTVIHLAAILSATGEKYPDLALKINNVGTQNVLEIARQKKGMTVFCPSTIAAFGPSSPRDNTPVDCVMRPTTMYGITKVYAELLGEYYFRKFGVDFRSLRYPGVISSGLPGGGHSSSLRPSLPSLPLSVSVSLAPLSPSLCVSFFLSVPSLPPSLYPLSLSSSPEPIGTTDYAVEIYYEALRHGSYTCFLSENTALPMMYMPDLLKGTVGIITADKSSLQRRVYNLSALSFTPKELAASIRRRLPSFEMRYQPDFRQAIADTWPRSLDDSESTRDWGWKPDYDIDRMTDDILEHLTTHHDEFKGVKLHPAA
jgi:threonine 3-dehydrogenase